MRSPLLTALSDMLASKARAERLCRDALEALPEEAFRLTARDAAIALPEGWKARFAWEQDKDLAWERGPDAIALTRHGVEVLRVLDLRRRPPYPVQWSVSRWPSDPATLVGCAHALEALARATRVPAPSFHPTFSRPDWDALA